ncbi:protein-L-isoaspartate(D-aspartate) O-methyltransferase [Streptomyces sp. NPDC005195]|uniref:protein-L-isoaspartate O-methyltransferase family protein n=1 Tax=Streptomyces sp. NPDC005195 TaxID=3154561 RepID=UPI0033BBCCF2
MKWEQHARRLAGELVRPESRWHEPLATTPRHAFVPRWWVRGETGRKLRTGESDPEAWMRTVYTDSTLVTRVGPHHADHAASGAVVESGRTTSSSTHPSLVVGMYRHAALGEGSRTVVTTGTGYGTALICRRLGDELVTSLDVDPYLVAAATERLDAVGLHPEVAVADLTKPLPGEYDRIVATVSVRQIPTTWLDALRPNGRMVTTITDTGLILVADKTADGGAEGHIPHDGAAFMRVRSGEDYEDNSPSTDLWEKAHGDGEELGVSRYPLVYVPDAWDVMSMLELTVPGVEHHRSRDGDLRTVWLMHRDGSWARATTSGRLILPTVHQGGPAASGTTSNPSATGSTPSGPCPSTAPGSPSHPTDRPLSPAERGP